jgi:hypothetical protein
MFIRKTLLDNGTRSIVISCMFNTFLRIKEIGILLEVETSKSISSFSQVSKCPPYGYFNANF